MELIHINSISVNIDLLLQIVEDVINIDDDHLITEDFKDEKILEVDRIIEDIFLELYKSILTGEYTEFNTAIGLTTEIITKTLNSYNKISQIEDFQFSHILTSKFKLLKLIVSYYKRFIENIKIHHCENKFDSIIFIDDQIEKESKSINIENKGISDRIEFLALNLDLAQCDHFQNDHIQRYIDLLNLRNNANQLKESLPSINKLFELFDEKLSFLIYKFQLRKQKISKDKNIPFLYVNGSLKEDDLNNIIFDIDKLNEWKVYIFNHYEIDSNWNEQIQTNFELFNYEFNNINNFKSVSNLHLYIKYFKDIKKSEKDLKNIRDNINLWTNISDYNSPINKVNKNYIINNYFSIYVKNKKLKVEDIVEEYENSRNLLNKNLNNFFLEFKLFEELSNRFKNNQQNILNEINTNIKNQIIEIFETYKNNVNWALGNQKYIFRLPKEESIFNIDKNKYGVDKLFIASAFVLPIDSSEISKNFEKNQHSYNLIMTLIETNTSINKEIEQYKDIKESVKNFEEKHKEAEKKSIEIISIFTAIITFVLSSIPAIKFINSFYSALLFMFALGGSLALFVALMLFAQNKFEKLSQVKIYFYTLIYVVILSAVLFIGFEKYTTNEKNRNSEIIQTHKSYVENLEKFHDSIKKIDKLKIDINKRDSILNSNKSK